MVDESGDQAQDATVIANVHHDVIPAEPVFEAELVDDDQYLSPRVGRQERIISWWLRSSMIPASLKCRRLAIQGVKDSLFNIARFPFRFVGAVARGLVVAWRAWYQWVRVADYRHAAENAEKLADKFMEIRDLTLQRSRITVGVLLFMTLAVMVVRMFGYERHLWSVATVGAVVLAVIGRRKDGSPGRTAVLSGPRTLRWTMDPQMLIDAFRDAKLIGKDEGLRLVERPTRTGKGWAVVVDLPATRKAADVVRNREALASALAVDEIQLSVERVRGNGGHAGRVALWVADSDPYGTPPVRTPLLRCERWDAWRSVPFGRDARERSVELPLMWTSMLIGAIPRQGKTFAARLVAAGLILDPYARLLFADFKAGKDWTAAEQVAYRFMAGDETEHNFILMKWLEELVADVQGRFRRMRDLDDEICPESKITPSIARNPALGMPVTSLIIDEVHVPLEDRTPVEVQGKSIPLGEYIGQLLTWLARKGPAAGIVLVLATQRPDSKTIPSRLRAVLGTRFALRVMDFRDSNIILGEQMNTRGFDSSRLLASHKGVGILRPDGEADTDALALTVRTYYMPNDDWRTVCQRGRQLRESEGTLSGHAAGETLAPMLDPADIAKAIGSGQRTVDQAEPIQEFGEPLASIMLKFSADFAEGGRDFIPTAELVAALDTDPVTFGADMARLGCRSTRDRVPTQDGTRQVRGYRVDDLRSVIAAREDQYRCADG